LTNVGALWIQFLMRLFLHTNMHAEHGDQKSATIGCFLQVDGIRRKSQRLDQSCLRK